MARGQSHVGPLPRIVVAQGLFQAALHTGCLATSRSPFAALPHLVAWLHDLALLALAALLVGRLGRLAPAAASGAARAAAVGALAALGGVLAIYPRMLSSFLAFPVNPFSADAATVRTFVTEYAGLEALWPGAAAVVVALAAARFRSLQVPRPGWRVVAPFAALVAATLLPPAPNPLTFGLQEEVRGLLSREPRAVPRLRPADVLRAAPSPPSASPLSARGEPLFSHVVVAVLEGVTSDAFERELLGKEGGFFARCRDRAAYFPRYHATNLDSYTSLIAMTTAQLVPFRAYTDPPSYERVNELPNLPRALGAKGFRTLFIGTYEHQPFVPNRRSWDRVADRGALGGLEGFVSLGGSRMEAATEDRAAIGTMVDFVRAAPRTLVMHELVYGHSPEWRALTGIPQLEYYDAYLRELTDRLDAALGASPYLLVVVSDHGERFRPGAPDNYRVPLLVVGAGVAPARCDGFYSHLDFQAILAHYLYGAQLPPERERSFAVGSTESWVYGELSARGGSLFIHEPSGRVLSAAGPVTPLEVHRRFQAHLGAFTCRVSSH